MRNTLLLLSIILSFSLYAQIIVNSAGAEATGQGGTLSYSVGQVFQSSSNSSAGYVTILNDDDATNELQNLSVSTTGDTLYLQNGGFVIIPGISAANADGGIEIGTYAEGTIHCNAKPTEVVDVIDPLTGLVGDPKTIKEISKLAEMEVEDLPIIGAAPAAYDINRIGMAPPKPETPETDPDDFWVGMEGPSQDPTKAEPDFWEGIEDIDDTALNKQIILSEDMEKSFTEFSKKLGQGMWGYSVRCIKD